MMSNRRSPLVAVIVLLLASGCGGDPAPRGAETSAGDDLAPRRATTDAPANAAATADIILPRGWPWRAAASHVPLDESWQPTLGYPVAPPFTAEAGLSLGTYLGSWAKFTLLTGDPATLYFQDVRYYPFHYDFAAAHLPLFTGYDAAAFDAVTLYNDGRKAILGTVLVPLTPNVREVGVQLWGRDAFDPRVVAVVMERVAAAIEAVDGRPPPTLFYFPTADQAPVAAAQAGAYTALGVAVSGPGRWTDGDVCYVGTWDPAGYPYDRDWALGRLVYIPHGDVAAAYVAGTLGPDDILLTDAVPAEIPLLAGVLTFAGANPYGRTGALAASFDIPFAYLPDPAAQAAARALSGHLVAIRLRSAPERITLGACDVQILDLAGVLSRPDRAAITALKAPLRLALPARHRLGAIAIAADDLAALDLDAGGTVFAHFGGAAARFGLLRRTLPDHGPTFAVALSFDLWDGFMDQPLGHYARLREAIADRLAGHSWPPEVATLAADLAAVRALIRDGAGFTAARRAAVMEALAPFDPTRELVFSPSTNVESGGVDAFTGAEPYPGVTGCLGDDQDSDDRGPSACDPAAPAEHGVYRAIADVYADFYTLNAYLERLRRGVDEGAAGVGMVVRQAIPAPELRGSGVATLPDGRSGTFTLVTQPGAVGVADPALPPEVAVPYVRNAHPYVVRASWMVPVGAMVLDWWRGDYASLASLGHAVAATWRATLPPDTPFRLALDYQQLAPDGTQLLTGLRPIRVTDPAETVRTYLLPSGPPRDFCLSPDALVSIWTLHRTKVRLRLTTAGAWLDRERLGHSYLNHITSTFLEGGAPVTIDAVPSALPGWFHRVEAGPDGDRVVVGWTRGVGAERRTFALSHPLRDHVTRDEIPIATLDDLRLELTIGYATPHLDLDIDEPTTEDVVHLGPCSSDALLTVLPEHVTVDTGGARADITFWYGHDPPPHLARWGETRITGVASVPIVLRGDWSQTLGIHSYFPLRADFLFEPRLEENLDPSLLAELAAADVWQIWVGTPVYGGDAVIRVIGFDGVAR